MRDGRGKSDSPVVPEKSPNKTGQPVAEGTEGRGLAKGNLPQQNASREPSRKDAPSALERVRQAANKDKQLRFTALLHHIYNPKLFPYTSLFRSTDLQYLGSLRTMPGNRLRRGWREKVWAKGTCSSKTRPGHRAGKTRLARSSGYVKQQRRISSCGSRRSCTTSTTRKPCAWPTSL